tara:strand:+ start:7650 stop:8225 length:576 start_codon:yes stop_codon:yes gene_type:complete
MWRRAARTALEHHTWSMDLVRGPLTNVSVYEVGGASWTRGYAKSKTPAKKRGGPVQGGSAPTSPAMKRSVDSHWQLLMDAATPKALEPENLSDEELEAFAAKAKEYSQKMMAQHRAWQKDINQKIRLKRAALAALPVGFLRDEASKEDLSLFPLKRQSPMLTPPIEGFYEEKQMRAEEAVSGIGGKTGPTR